MKRTITAVVALFAALTLSAAAKEFTRECYIDIMETAVGAYSPERLSDYIAEVEKKGISEHGFARLTSNIGILLAHGRRMDLKDTFECMMDICAREIPVCRNRYARAGNDFAIKEICCCLRELYASDVFPKEKVEGWKNALSGMKAKDIYSEQPVPGDAKARNWCVYGAASECARLYAGIGGERSYADLYLGDQLRFFDKNGMFKDPGQPMVYDLVTRLQFMACLHFGYDGPAKVGVEENLLKSAFHTLEYLSVTGELPYGGRSNGFLFNESFVAATCEYYATWFKQMGDMKAASRFKAAARRAVESQKYWTEQEPIRHIKNRYPTETKYGCEGYAYFDKYMVTMGSFAYLGYLFADDSIMPATKPEKPSTFVTAPEFHRIFMKNGGYFVEFDTDAQEAYDSNGLGRIQKAGASPVIALSAPCPTNKCHYTLDIEEYGPFCISPLWQKYRIASAGTGKVVLTDGKSRWTNRLSKKGLEMVVEGEGVQTLTLPALEFDGESYPEIICDGKSLSVYFNGSECRYTTNGKITDTGKVYANRNGHLHRFDATADGKLIVKVRVK